MSAFAPELSPEIRLQLQKVSQKPSFLQSLQSIIKTAMQTLTSSLQVQDPTLSQHCPTALLLSLSHCLSYSLPFSTLTPYLPESCQQLFIFFCNKYFKPPSTFREEGLKQLIDVRWEMEIGMGRQLWKVELVMEGGVTQKMVLSYEELSVLVFKIGQIVGFVQNYKM